MFRQRRWGKMDSVKSTMSDEESIHRTYTGLRLKHLVHICRQDTIQVAPRGGARVRLLPPVLLLRSPGFHPTQFLQVRSIRVGEGNTNRQRLPTMPTPGRLTRDHGLNAEGNRQSLLAVDTLLGGNDLAGNGSGCAWACLGEICQGPCGLSESAREQSSISVGFFLHDWSQDSALLGDSSRGFGVAPTQDDHAHPEPPSKGGERARAVVEPSKGATE